MLGLMSLFINYISNIVRYCPHLFPGKTCSQQSTRKSKSFSAVIKFMKASQDQDHIIDQAESQDF